MKIVVISLLVLVACCYATDCDNNDIVNGCSVEIGDRRFDYFYKDNFTPDCNKHDICYNCGAGRDISRRSCDRIFRRNLINRCGDDDRINNKVWCRMVTFDYYVAVRALGRRRYQTTSPSWCDESWVDECMA